MSHRIHSYDFFQGVLAAGLIFLLSFLGFSGSPEVEIFYRWASLGFLFFSGLIIGEVLWEKKTAVFFFRRGIQVLGVFFILNIVFSLLFFPHFFPAGSFSLESWENLSLLLLKGDFSFVGSLLLPVGAFFLITPILRIIPSFLGVFWSAMGFILLDVISIEKDIFFLNAMFLMTAIAGFYVGRTFSLESVRHFINSKLSILPAFFLYLAVIILMAGGLLTDYFVSAFSDFWSFHLIIFFLFFFAIPNTLFEARTHRPLSRTFFETLGVEVLFVYILSSLLTSGMAIVFTRGLPFSGIEVLLIALHLSIFSFAVVSVARKFSRKSKVFKKIFRFLF